MEKRTPHCKLYTIKTLVSDGKIKATFSALAGAATLGLEFEDIVTIVMDLTTKDFYKSMTSYADHRVWQDVYRPKTNVADVYLKLTVTDDVVVISFKEL